MKQAVIFGAGQYGRKFYEVMTRQGVDVTAFVDENLVGKNVESLPVISISDCPTDIAIYVSVSPMRNTDRVKVKEKLNNQGYSEVYDFFESIRSFPEILKEYARYNHLWMRENLSETIDLEKIERFGQLLSDEKSRQVLQQIVSFRQSLSPVDYVSPDGQEEYFPEDVPLFRDESYIRFADCGGYIGDTIESLFQYSEEQEKTVQSCVSFEPDAKNLQALLKIQRDLVLRREEAQLSAYPCGVWSENTLLSFQAQSNSSSTISIDSDTDSSIRIPVVSIDDTIYGMRPNYIKMDIEGAERQALAGAEKTIKSFRPHLAICVYHKPSDLWELPLYIHKIMPEYDMYLRVHEHMGLSTVLYCLPK